MNTELTQEVMNLVKKHKLLGSGSNADLKLDVKLSETTLKILSSTALVLVPYSGDNYEFVELSPEEAIQVAVALLNNVIYPK